MPILLVLGGLALLAAGGEAVVRGAVQIAKELGLSKLLIGLVIVAFGTSAPELAVSVRSVFKGEAAIAVGNVIGSNISNLMLVLALPAIMHPIAGYNKSVMRDAVFMLGSSVLFVWIAHSGQLTQQIGLLFVGALICYIIVSYFTERNRVEPLSTLKHALELETPAKPHLEVDLTALGSSILWIFFGIAALIFGAGWLVDGSTQIAQILGVPDAVIGLTVVAVGTSLPELATVIMAGLRREAELAIGGIIGSNIFNILAVLGISAAVHPFAIDPSFLALDVWVMLGATLIVMPFLASDWRIARWEGVALLVLYIAYVAYRYVNLGTPSSL